MPEQNYTFGSEQDVRNVMKLFVDAIKLWQVRAVSLDRAVNGIMGLPPTKRAALSATELDAVVRDLRIQAGAAADLMAAEVEKKLEGGDFLSAARHYASKQFWDGSGF